MPEGKENIMDQCPEQGCFLLRKFMEEVKGDMAVLRKHDNTLARIDERLRHGDNIMNELNKFLQGNGRPGILERLTRIEGKQKIMWALFFLFAGAIVTEFFK